MAAHDARLTAIEQQLSIPDSTSVTPSIPIPMEVSLTATQQNTTIDDSTIPPVAPSITNSQHNTFDERLLNIDNRYTRMERALGTITNLLSSFTGNSVHDSFNPQ